MNLLEEIKSRLKAKAEERDSYMNSDKCYEDSDCIFGEIDGLEMACKIVEEVFEELKLPALKESDVEDPEPFF